MKKKHAWHPADYDEQVVAAIQALAKGEAQPHQQALTLKWIIEEASGYYDLSFHPESERDTCFAEGKRFVGSQIVKLTKLNLNVFRRTNDGRSKSTDKHG